MINCVRKIILVASILSSNVFAQAYCESVKWNSQTRFDGNVGNAGDTGVVVYLGKNPLPSDNTGTYKFISTTQFQMEFAGEPRHVCNKTIDFHWSCQMGRWFRYTLECQF